MDCPILLFGDLITARFVARVHVRHRCGDGDLHG